MRSESILVNALLTGLLTRGQPYVLLICYVGARLTFYATPISGGPGFPHSSLCRLLSLSCYSTPSPYLPSPPQSLLLTLYLADTLARDI